MSADDNKKWGTIFLDAGRESSLSKLDAMQAASRQEQWHQKTQQDYLEKVRQKAIDRAREILGEAYTERVSVLEEAERDAERIREEARAAYTAAEEARSQAQEIRHAAQAELDNATHIRSSAHEEGFQAGISAAQEELTNFRISMGSSVAGVLQVITAQCMYIFNDWRSELVELTKVCVEKGTNLALSERHAQIMEAMLLRAVRNLDERRSVTLRVNPDDEPVVEDLFQAAKEKNPDLSPWRISADAALAPGDIIAESLTGTVDSRRELYHQMVENIIRHLSLPEAQSEADALARIQAVLEEEIQKVIALTPTLPEPEPEPEAEPMAPQAEPIYEEAEQEQAAPVEDIPPEILAELEYTPDITREMAANMAAGLPPLAAGAGAYGQQKELSPEALAVLASFEHADDASHSTDTMAEHAADPTGMGSADMSFAHEAPAAHAPAEMQQDGGPARVSFDHAEEVQAVPLSPEEFEKQRQLAEQGHMGGPASIAQEPTRQQLEEELLPVEANLLPATLEENTTDGINSLDEQGLPISQFDAEDFNSEEFFEESHEAYSPIKDKA